MPEAIPDLLRCPECGASNPAGAGWCGQCLRRFDAEPASEARAAQPSIVSSIRTTAGGPVVHAREGEEPVWSCPACDTENPLSSDACSRCGSAFTSFFPREPEHAGARASAKAAIAFTAVLPGAGHWVYRDVPAAIARSLLYVWSVGIAILLLARPPAAGRALVRGIGVCFALTAAGLWLISMLEVMRLGEGDRRPLIPPKALTWLTAGMSALLFLGLLGAIIVGR
jgi:ribosomal protein L40E